MGTLKFCDVILIDTSQFNELITLNPCCCGDGKVVSPFYNKNT